MLVATIGSCLSSRVVRYIPSVQHVSSVYHNRSDQLAAVLSGRRKLLPISELSRRMGVEAAEWAEFSSYNVLMNQSHEGFGRHNLPDGMQLLDALDNVGLDLILVDNFIDIVGRTYQIESGPIFCTYPRGKAPAGLKLGSHLLPDESARNYTRILKYLRAKQPRARIMFLNFPVNNFPDIEKTVWALRFQSKLAAPPSVEVFWLRNVAPQTAGIVPQHFDVKAYRRYAGEIMQLMKAGRKTRIKERRRENFRLALQGELPFRAAFSF